MLLGLLKKHRTYKLTVLCLIIILLLSGVYIYVTNYALATISFLGNIFSQVTETEQYYVVVKNDNEYSKLNDIKGKKVQIFQIDDEVKNEVKNKVDVEFSDNKDLVEMGKNLLDDKSDVILTSSIQYDMMSEEIEDFKEKTKILHTIEREIKVKASAIETEGSNKKVENGIFNVYISGIDTSGNITNVSRSDANILLTVNAKTKEILLTSIPRDYYVTLHSYGAKDKLTHSGIYGINETVRTVEDLLDVDINYYVRVNFTTVIKLVDKLGGIDVYSDYSFSRNGYYFSKGYNHLYGDAALVFSRERKSFSGGDNQRVKNQQHVIEAIMKKVLNSTTILTKYTSILDSLEGSFQTNIKQSEISDLVKQQLNDMSSWTIKNNSLTGSGANLSTYSMGSQRLYVMIPDSTSVSNAKQQINNIMGED